MKIFFIIAVVVFCCTAPVHLFSQNYSYKHYGITDGLVGNNVYHAIEDKEGFLWLATETGVSRFDGTNFKNFTTEDGLPDNEILRLFEDSKGRIWMLPFKNDLCYYYKGKIHNAVNDSILKKIKIDDRIVNVTGYGKDNLLFFENTKLISLEGNNQVFYATHEKGKTFIIYGSGADDLKDPYAYVELSGERSALYKVNVNDGGINLVKKERVSFWGNKSNYSHINQYLYVYLNNSAKRWDLNHLVFDYYKKDFKDTLETPSGLNTISFLNDTLLFFNTDKGVYQYNYRQHTTIAGFLKEEAVSCTLTDRENNIWFTTIGHGIFRLLSEENKNIFLSNKGGRVSVEAILPLSKTIIIGTVDSVLYKFKKSGGEITRYNIPSTAGIRKIKKLKLFDNSLYILTETSLLKADTELLKPMLIPTRAHGMWSFKDMDMVNGSEFYFATHFKGVFHTKGFKRDSLVIPERCTSVCMQGDRVYFGTLTGLKYSDPHFNVFDLGNQFPVLKNRITRLCLSKNKLWVGTNTNGVICFDGQKIVKSITTKDGLTGNLIRAIFADNNYLWIGTDRGLNKISLLDTTYPVMQTYSSSDGITSDMINAICVQNDTVYIGTPEGLSYFNEKRINSNSICDLRVLAITVSGKELHYDSSKIVLNNDDNNIRFDFVGISYKAEGRVKYYYKLSGIDSSWKTTKENFLQYPTLPSGTYSMALYAINKFGKRSKTITIDFDIRKKLTEESWFIGLIAVLFALSAWFLVNWQIRKIKKTQKEKSFNAQKIAQLEQQALKSQMNPHFIFNCLNSIQQYVIDKDVQGANRFISGFSRLIRQTLDNSGKQHITVAEEERFLIAYLQLEKSRFEEKFDFHIWIDPAIRKDEDVLPPMLLQPYIENCIRHGIMHKSNGKGLIDIRFNLENNRLICSVKDNGIGREAANGFKGIQHFNYQSKGTEVTGQRIMMINKSNDADIILKTEDLVDGSGQPCGTKVTIVIPLHKAY